MKNGKSRKEEWWVYFRFGYSDYDEDHVVVLPTVAKLLYWIARNAHRCAEVEIVLREA